MDEIEVNSRPVRHAALLAPETLLSGRYRVVRPIGEGGFGVVYEVEHVDLGKRFALKVLAGAREDKQVLVERLRREAITTSQIAHPNIVNVTDFGTIGQRIYYVMELLEGKTLQAHMRGKTYSLSQALPILIAISDALGAAHRAGVVHRDLKPANIFLVPMVDAQRGTRRQVVKILDFGLATLASSRRGPRLTKQGCVVGTAGYVAPEQVTDQPVDHRSDIYSFGCVAFEMFAGRPPFSGKRLEVVLAHCEKPAPLVRARNPLARIPPQMEQLIARCLEKAPGRRPASFRVVLEELRQLARAMLTLDGKTWDGSYSLQELSELVDAGDVQETDVRPWNQCEGVPADQGGSTMGVASDEAASTPSSDEFAGPTVRYDTMSQVAAGGPIVPARVDTPVRRTRVLVAEPNQQLAHQLKDQLLAHGFLAELVSGRKVLSAATVGRPDLIYLSVEQPDVSGYAVCSRLKGDQSLRRIPVILATVDASDETFRLHQTLDARADAYLIKPFTREEVLEQMVRLAAGEEVEPPTDESMEPEFQVADCTDVVDPVASDVPPLTPHFLSTSGGRLLVLVLVLVNLVVLTVTLLLVKRRPAQSQATMVVEVEPREATVRVGGKEIGPPGHARVAQGLRPGWQNVEVSAPSCKTVRRRIELLPGPASVVRIKLSCSRKPPH